MMREACQYVRSHFLIRFWLYNSRLSHDAELGRMSVGEPPALIRWIEAGLDSNPANRPQAYPEN